MSALDVGDPRVLKNMFGIIMDVDDSAIRALIQNLQVLRMKEAPEENVGTVVSFLKGVLVLIQNCATLLTGTIALMNNTM